MWKVFRYGSVCQRPFWGSRPLRGKKGRVLSRPRGIRPRRVLGAPAAAPSRSFAGRVEPRWLCAAPMIRLPPTRSRGSSPFIPPVTWTRQNCPVPKAPARWALPRPKALEHYCAIVAEDDSEVFHRPSRTWYRPGAMESDEASRTARRTVCGPSGIPTAPRKPRGVSRTERSRASGVSRARRREEAPRLRALQPRASSPGTGRQSKSWKPASLPSSTKSKGTTRTGRRAEPGFITTRRGIGTNRSSMPTESGTVLRPTGIHSGTRGPISRWEARRDVDGNGRPFLATDSAST